MLPSRVTVLESYATLDECSFTQCNFKHWLKWCTYSAVWLLHGWYHVKLLPSQRTFCAHHTAMHQFTVLFEATYVVCLAVTYHLYFWQNDHGLLHATAVTLGWNGCWSQHRKLTLEKKILPPQLTGLEPAAFQSWAWNSTNGLSLLPRSQLLKREGNCSKFKPKFAC